MMQLENVLPLERVIRRAPLALRLTDSALNHHITDQMLVSAFRLDPSRAPAFQTLAGSPTQVAARSPMSGIYGFASLDGLVDYEWDRKPASAYCPGPNSTPNYALVIQDMADRFISQTMAVCLPNAVPQDNLFEIDLFPAAMRILPDTFGVLRADVWDANHNRPAAWALLTATFAPNLSYVTMADARGVVALFIPYPAPDLSPQFGVEPIYKLTWPCDVQVYYTPTAHKFVLQPTGAKIAGLPPTTKSIFDQQTQPPVAIVINRPLVGPPIEADILQTDLAFHKDLVLRTGGEEAPGTLYSRLLIKP